ncbi:MAG: alpha/beta hydrolase [Anaerolineales bacterium]|jgi:pimeloyl-ACP methyl ester carboxylesterase|nr:alpha/beta hydrolase [Anaerolineales bacterium]
MPAYEHTYLQINAEIRLHLVLAGPPEGKPILLLHGFPEFWYGWRNQIMALAAKGYRVIAPDQRGYNLSSAPKAVAAYGLDHLSQDVIFILDHFGIEKVSLVGHDWGAAVAWTVALLHPERVERLAILNVPHPAVMMNFIRKNPQQMLKSWYIAFFQIPGLADWLMRLNNFEGVLKMLTASGQPGTFSPEDLSEYRKAYSNSGGLTGMINWYRALVRHPLKEKTKAQIELPVLILWGKKDIALSAKMAEESLKLSKNGRLIFFENATHWVQHDEAAAITGELLQFMKKSP